MDSPASKEPQKHRKGVVYTSQETPRRSDLKRKCCRKTKQLHCYHQTERAIGEERKRILQINSTSSSSSFGSRSHLILHSYSTDEEANWYRPTTDKEGLWPVGDNWVSFNVWPRVGRQEYQEYVKLTQYLSSPLRRSGVVHPISPYEEELERCMQSIDIVAVVQSCNAAYHGIDDDFSTS